jgi:hypothetical protein
MVTQFITADGAADFRAWLPGETPKKYAMQIYLQSDHDGLVEEQIVKLLKQLNKTPALPTDFKITGLTPQADKQGNPKGRVCHLSTGATFYGFCKERGFELMFVGGKVPCITAEDKQRNLHQQKRKASNEKGGNKGNHERKGPKDGGKDNDPKKPKTRNT